MATKEEKIAALTNLMVEGTLTAEEFSRVVSVLDGSNALQPTKEKSPLEEQYDEVFSKHIINVFKSPASCKWPELQSSMIKKGSIKVDGSTKEYTYIETYIDAPNAYGTMLRKQLKLVMNDDGKITRALEELKVSSVTLLGALANAANKDTWHDIVKF